MDNEVSGILLNFLKKYRLPFLLAIVGLIFFIYGLIALWSQNQGSPDIKFETNSTAVNKSDNLITVDIEGAVSNPGVYRLKLNSIIQDGLVAAGGLSNEADRDFVSKSINLATKLTDGQKIYIPKIGQSAPEALGSTSTVTNSSLININTALEKELDTLPGVGPVTAAKIINNRPYLDINDLVSKSVVSQKVFDQVKDKITAY